MIRASVAILTLLAVPAVLANEPPPTRTEPPVVGWIDAAKPFCYARSYDAAHMAKHPRQKVTAIAISYVPEKTFFDDPVPQKLWDIYSEAPAFSAIMSVRLKGDERVWLAAIYCQTGSPKLLKCGVDGDGGLFNVLLEDDGRVKLVNPGSMTIEFPPPEGADDDHTTHASIDAKDDHAAFLLAPASGGLCDDDWPPPIAD